MPWSRAGADLDLRLEPLTEEVDSLGCTSRRVQASDGEPIHLIVSIFGDPEDGFFGGSGKEAIARPAPTHADVNPDWWRSGAEGGWHERAAGTAVGTEVLRVGQSEFDALAP